MASKIITKGLKRTALSVALGMCFAGSVYAQSNSTGNIVGQTTAGGTVVVENAATGFRREVTADASGNYRIGNLPIGTYKVTAGGQSREVSVSVGSNVQGTSLGTVTVQGGQQINAIDVASVESTTILTAEQIAKIPVPRDITSVALLAPGTVRGDAAFGNLASFGGGAVSENQYYVNGFNITNAFKNLNFGQVPFEAIAEQQIKTGGYGAEFGRSTGGVINLVTKRGTNEFHAGGNIFYTPESLRGHNPDVFYNDPRYPDGKRWVSDNSQDTLGTTISGSVWASGALVKDRLFAYALLQYAEVSDRDTYGSIFSTNNLEVSQEVPTWLLKMDWNINDSHILELTAFSDVIKADTKVYANASAARSSANLGPRNCAANGPDLDPGPGVTYCVPGNTNPYPPLTPATTDLGADLATVRTGELGTVFDETGGTSWSLKYTGYLTDNFTLSALYGRGDSSRANYAVTAGGIRSEYDGTVGGAVSGCPVIASLVGPVPPNCFFVTSTGQNLGVVGAEDTREQFRIDAEWALGDHLLRFGIDTDNFTSVDGETTEGGSSWQYRSDYRTVSALNPGSVRRRLFQSGAEVEVNSQAYYIEDKWQVTPNFLALIGLRWDSFENVNAAGETFVEIKNQFGPRLGFSWDVNGDSKFKVYGNAGRYSLPLTATVAVRGASASLFLEQFYTFTGVAADGSPTGLVKVPNAACGGCLDRYLNNEFGLGKDARTIADQNLKPMYQDEYILGFQAQLSDNVAGGVRGIYRDLKAAIDDQCDYRPIYAYAVENGLDFNPAGTEDAPNTGFAYCHLYNPGEDASFLIDIDGDGTLETVNLTAEQLGPEAKRTYKALEFFLEGSWDKFFVQGSYTWSKSQGNTEGGVKSDIGQDDTGTTQDFDYPELTIGSYGYLPNDRRHVFKVFGNYDITDQWSVGANLLIQSGRPINCFGFLAGANTAHYANGYFSCDDSQTGFTLIPNPAFNPLLPVNTIRFLPDGSPNPAWNPVNITRPGQNGGLNNGSTIVPRGTRGRTEWTRTLDLNVNYHPNWAEGLQFKVDVFNVFNSHAVQSVIEQGENAAGEPQPDRYKTPTGFQAARSVRFMVQYDF